MAAPSPRWVLRVLLVPVVLVALAACGDDDAPAGPGDTASWCDAVIEFDTHLVSLPPADTLDEFYQQVADVLPMVRSLASGAPAEIRADMNVLAESFELIARGDESPMFDPAYEEAFDRFETYVGDECDYELQG